MRCAQPGRAAAMAASGHQHDAVATHQTMRGHLRPQARPHKMLAGLMLAALAAQAAVWLTGDAALVALSVAAVSLVATIAAAIARSGHGARAVARVALAALAGCAWLTWTALSGITWTAVGVLLTIGYGMALPHWRNHRIPNPEEPTAPEPPPGEDTTARLWRLNLAGNGGLLAGSFLTQPESTDAYERWIVMLKPGKQSIALFRKADNLELIAGALGGIDPADILIEEYRHRSGKVDASRAVLTITHRSPVQESVTYPGPTFRWEGRTGIIDLGPYSDGNGVAAWKLFSKNSMWGGVVLGATGSGKSRLLEGLACSALSTGLVTLLYADPQRGNSSSALADHAYRTARGVDQCMQMLRGVRRVMVIRELVNQSAGRTGFTPQQDWPGILVILDECHMVLGDPTLPEPVRTEAVWLAEQISRVGRKLGIALVLASQEGDVKVFGGSNGLRSNLRQGNTIVMRSLNKQLPGVLGVNFTPATLPEGGGYGYTQASPELGGRTAPFRGYYLDELEDDEYPDVRDNGKPPRQGTGYWWLSRHQSAPLDPYTERAAEGYLPRHEEADRDRQRATDALAAFVDGTLTLDDLLGKDKPKPAQRQPAAPRLPSAAPAAAPAITAGDSPYGKVLHLPVYRRPAKPEPASPQRGEDLVYQLIREGVTTPKELTARTGYNRGYVHELLNALRERGLIYSPRQGVWWQRANEQPTQESRDIV